MATATVTPGYNWVSGEVVTPAKMNNAAAPTVAVSNIVNADVASGAAIALSKLATGALPTAITVASANLVDGTIVDADISASAEIAGSKLEDATITTAKLASATQQSLVPAGAVMPFAMNSAPAGWLAAAGAAVSRTTYATLFAAIGTTYGSGDGSTTFNLPDLRGIFVRGSESQTISGTTYSATFAVKQQDAMQGHRHGTSVAMNLPDAPGISSLVAGSGFGSALITNPTTDGTNGTPRTASETRPANIALLYCIKF